MPDLSESDADMIARTAASEAGDAGPEAMAAVISSIKNRLDSGRYGDTIPQIILAPHQYEPWSLPRRNQNHPLRVDPQSDDYKAAYQATMDIFGGNAPDTSNGATHFVDPQAQRALGRRMPSWARGQQPLATVGPHKFYAPEGQVMPDLLGEWATSVNAPPSNAPAPASATADDTGDLLSEWAAAVNPPDQQPAAPIPWQHPELPHVVIPPANSPPPVAANVAPTGLADLLPTDEPPGLTTAKFIAAHQGSGPINALARLGGGAVRGVEDVGATLAQGAANLGQGGAGVLEQAGIISPESQTAVRGWADLVNARIARDQQAYEAAGGNTGLAAAGRFGGQIAATGPLLSAAAAPLTAIPYAGGVLGGAATGAGAAGLTAASSDQPIGQQIAEGAVGGGIAGGATNALAAGIRTLAGKVDPYVARLAQEAKNRFGIDLSATQISQNPIIRFTDSMLQRMPFTGFGKRTAEQNAQFSQALAAEMGTSADRITPDIISRNLQALGNEYKAWDARIGPQSIDQTFYDDLKNVKDNADFNLEPAKAKLIDRHIDNVFSKISPHALEMDPEQYRSLTRHGGPLDNAISGKDPGLAHYAGQIKGALEHLVARNDPALKAAKDQLDYRYAVTKALEDPANKSTTGVLPPQTVFNALATSGHTNAATQIGRIGGQFLREPQSSGTTERAIATALIGTAASAPAAIGWDEYVNPDDTQSNLAKLGVYGVGLLGARYGLNKLRGPGLTNALLANSLGLAVQPGAVRRAAPIAAGLATRNNALLGNGP